MCRAGAADRAGSTAPGKRGKSVGGTAWARETSNTPRTHVPCNPACILLEWRPQCLLRLDLCALQVVYRIAITAAHTAAYTRRVAQACCSPHSRQACLA
eukprot:365252-Chlamydomonas_euryale.AAC.47